MRRRESGVVTERDLRLGKRTLGCWCRLEVIDALDELAADAGTSRGRLLNRIVEEYVQSHAKERGNE
jgi:hypothetical protein